MRFSPLPRSVFRRLRLFMLAFGALIGLLFPPVAAAVLGSERALSPFFFALCVLAGLTVGHMNYVLFERVVSRELERLVSGMRKLLDAVTDRGEMQGRPAPLDVVSADAVGEVAAAFNTMTDAVVTRLEREVGEARQREAHFRFLTETMHELVCLHEPDDAVSYVSPSCERLLGYTPAEMLHRDPLDWVHSDDLLRLRQGGIRDVIRGEVPSLTYRALHKAGHVIWLETYLQVVRDGSGRPLRLVSTSRDVTERKEAETALERSALHDALTGLANRTLFRDRLTQALEREKRRPESGFAVLFLDFDRFKAVNDTLGHSVGDALLCAIGERLRGCVRPADTVARLGGDEFTLLLEDVTSIEEVVKTAERVLQTCSRPYELGGQQVTSTASVGIVTSDIGYDQVDEVIRDADIAMYQAKASGRARYQLFTPSLRQQVLGHLALEKDLRQALAQEALELHYQPIVEVETGQPAGFEALVRWTHPEHGNISPQAFIPLAEDTGLIVELDRFMLRRACEQVSAWQRAYPQLPPLTLSVNLSGRSFAAPDLPRHLADVLEQTGFAPHDLKLEITESTLMKDLGTVSATLEEIRAMGVQLHVDDFGTGYSSLAYLQNLPVSTLKIDHSFVEKMTRSPESAELVRTVVAMARSLKLEVVAEGVETDEQLAQLRLLGCEYAQGFLFAKPLGPADVDRFISLARRGAQFMGVLT